VISFIKEDICIVLVNKRNGRETQIAPNRDGTSNGDLKFQAVRQQIQSRHKSGEQLISM
jgi:hypothetical protein